MILLTELKDSQGNWQVKGEQAGAFAAELAAQVATIKLCSVTRMG